MTRRMKLAVAAFAAVAAAVAFAVPALGGSTDVPSGTGLRVIGTVRIEGMRGEAAQDAINIRSLRWGVSRSSTNSFTRLTMVKLTDTTTPEMLVATAEGKHFARMDLALLGGRYKVVLTDARITSVSSEQDGTPNDTSLDQVSIAFQRIEISVQALKADGTLDVPHKGGWDLATDRKI